MISKKEFLDQINSVFPIQVGHTYIFTKSGNEVRVIESSSVMLNGKTVQGHTVERVDSGKRLFAPEGTLKTKAELSLGEDE